MFEEDACKIPKMKDRWGQAAEKAGLPFSDRTHTYNSRLAQELAKWAEIQPGGGAIHDALFRAYFVDGINLARIGELAQIADSVGLSQEEAREVLDNRSFAASVDGDWRRASEFGVTGVPTFVINGRGVVGAQPYDTLEQLVSQGGAERRP